MAGIFDGKHVVITGAGGGLGPAVLDALVAAGASCHVPQRKGGEITARANVRIVTGVDLTDEGAVERFYAGCPPLWASIHVAGGFAMSAFVDTSLADLKKQLDINLTTAFLCTREAVKRIRAGSGGGRVVNVASRAALVPQGGTVAYGVSKAAVVMMTQAVAEELKGTGILVNAVAPQTIDTPTNRKAMPNADFSKWAKPADLARAILWLASPENALTSGAVVPQYG